VIPKTPRKLIQEQPRLKIKEKDERAGSFHFHKTTQHSKHPSFNLDSKKEYMAFETNKLQKKTQLKKQHYNEVSKYAID
jgi:hypothetical protein